VSQKTKIEMPVFDFDWPNNQIRLGPNFFWTRTYIHAE